MLVIGLGHQYREDDRAGLLAIARLRTLISELDAEQRQIELVAADGSAVSLMELWRGREQVFVIDAVMAPQATVGEIYVIDALHEEIPRGFGPFSSHAFGLAEAVALAREFKCLPDSLTIIGIVGATFNVGESMTAGMESAVDEVAQRICAILRKMYQKNWE